MLVVTLAKSENKQTHVQIETSDGPIEVRLTQVKGKQVRIGFIAPENVIINRIEKRVGQEEKSLPYTRKLSNEARLVSQFAREMADESN